MTARPYFELASSGRAQAGTLDASALEVGARVLSKIGGLECGPEEGVARLFLDTFDWRVWNAGLVLERMTLGAKSSLILRDRETGEVIMVADQRQIPRFAEDLPAGYLRDRVGGLLSMRALIPLAGLKGRRRAVVRRDREGKEVVRGSLEGVRVYVPSKNGANTGSKTGKGARGDAIGVRLFLEPVRGYEKLLESTADKITDTAAFTAAPGSPFDESMGRLRLSPGDYSSKVRLSLMPEMRADEAMQVILRDLFAVMTANEAGMVADIDTEFLHDFRVAIRRTRSALAQVKGVLPDRITAKYARAFRWLGQVTSPLRDLDVYLLTFDKYRDYLPTDFRESLDPLKAEIERRRARELRRVQRVIKGARYRKLKEDWAATLDRLITRETSAPNAGRPVTDVADERIWKLFKRALAEGGAIDDRSPPEALHDLRKTTKKLRYMMEFFQSLHDRDQVKDRIKALKVLQDDLGAFQDYAVQAETLEALASDMEAAGRARRDTLLAMAILTGALHDKQDEARAAFARIFDDFAAAQSRAAFKALYKR